MKNYINVNILLNNQHFEDLQSVDVHQNNDKLSISKTQSNKPTNLFIISMSLLNYLKETENQILELEIQSIIEKDNLTIKTKYISGHGEWLMTNSAEIKEKYDAGMTTAQIEQTTKCYSISKNSILFEIV
jgi:hypothetical protein